MSAEGRTPSAVSKSIEPLAKFYREFKPDVKRLVISQDDYDRLANCTKATLDRNHFRRIGDGFYWREFEIVRK